MRKLAVLFLLLSFSAFAHKVNLFLDKEDGSVIAYGYFADGTPAKNSPVEVYDAKSGKLLLKGKTDEDGFFKFRVPEGVSEVKVVLYGGLGHRAVQTLGVSPETSAPKGEGEEKPSPTAGGNAALKLPAKEVLLIVKLTNGTERKVILKLSPDAPSEGPPARRGNSTEDRREMEKIKKLVAKETAFPWEKVFCGVGWILGIFGIWSLIYERRRKG